MAKTRTRKRKKRTRTAAPPYTYVLGKGGPTLLDLRARRSEIRILVTGPGMLYETLRLITSLSISEGCHYRSMQRLAEGLQATALCGSAGSRPVDVRVVGRRTSAVLEIGLGPSSMYQNELVLGTRNGWSLKRLIHRSLTDGFSGDDYLVALEPIPASGHLEHEMSMGGAGSTGTLDRHGGHGHG